MTRETDETKTLDERYREACEIVSKEGVASICHLQRSMLIGYNRAARLIEAMETDGLVSHADKFGKRHPLTPNAAHEPTATNKQGD